MSDHRRAKRRRAAGTIEVFDTMTEQTIGTIGNLSENGMLALTCMPMVDDALYQLSFKLVAAGGQRREIEIGAHQLWSEPANVAGQYWSGFRFIEISHDDVAFMREWVEEPGVEYV